MPLAWGLPGFGWTEGTEIEFMIDTGCQVTILATSVTRISGPHIRISGPAPAMSPAYSIGRLVSADGTWGNVYDGCLPRFTV